MSAASALVIDPEPYRKRAVAMLDDENRKVRALAEVVKVMCDNYDDLRAVYDLKPGMTLKSGTWPF